MTDNNAPHTTSDDALLDLSEVEYYRPGMILDPASRKFAPTGTRGWLFHDAGDQALELLKPLKRSHLSRLSWGRLHTRKMKDLVDKAAEREHWEREVLSRASRWFEVTSIGFRLRTRRDVTERQMNDILKVATELMSHPDLNKGCAKGTIQFRMADGNFFVATWNSSQRWFDIQSGAVVPVLREGSTSWKPRTK